LTRTRWPESASAPEALFVTGAMQGRDPPLFALVVANSCGTTHLKSKPGCLSNHHVNALTFTSHHHGDTRLNIKQFYLSCEPDATEEGIPILEDVVIKKRQAVQDREQVVKDREADITTLSARHRVLNAMTAKAAKEYRQAESGLIDEFIFSATEEFAPAGEQDSAGFPARRAELKWRHDLLVSAIQRVGEVLHPRASIEKQRALHAAQGAVVDFSESVARVFVARKILLMKPLAEAEGSSLVTSGGVTDVIVTEWVEQCSKYAQMSDNLRALEEHLAEHQKKHLQ
jgi:hypothetical protein